MSPVILENSGIGQRAVLDRIGVSTLVDLPGVGENLQDHPYAGEQTSSRLAPRVYVSFLAVSYEVKPGPGVTSFDMLRDPDFAQEQLRLQYAFSFILVSYRYRTYYMSQATGRR